MGLITRLKLNDKDKDIPKAFIHYILFGYRTSYSRRTTHALRLKLIAALSHLRSVCVTVIVYENRAASQSSHMFRRQEQQVGGCVGVSGGLADLRISCQLFRFQCGFGSEVAGRGKTRG